MYCLIFFEVNIFIVFETIGVIKVLKFRIGCKKFRIFKNVKCILKLSSFMASLYLKRNFFLDLLTQLN